jgi:calcineurin-like phosphoesterase family protein
MKILTIGDVHGRDHWKEIVEQDFDKVIFIGDYFDSWSIPFDKQFQNFQDIVEFKKNNVDKVVLLFGNHDYHYMAYTDDRYSGYQTEHAPLINAVLAEALSHGYMQMCTVDDGFLFTHAGVTNTWAKWANINLDNLEGSINKCFLFTPQMFKFMDYQGADGSGDNIWQSPIWVRPDSLYADMIDGYIQVVGHSTQSAIEVGSVILIDVPGQYLEINNKEIICHKLPSLLKTQASE